MRQYNSMERRKVTFKLYPNAREAERLTAWVRLLLQPDALAILIKEHAHGGSKE